MSKLRYAQCSFPFIQFIHDGNDSSHLIRLFLHVPQPKCELRCLRLEFFFLLGIEFEFKSCFCGETDDWGVFCCVFVLLLKLVSIPGGGGGVCVDCVCGCVSGCADVVVI